MDKRVGHSFGCRSLSCSERNGWRYLNLQVILSPMQDLIETRAPLAKIWHVPIPGQFSLESRPTPITLAINHVNRSMTMEQLARSRKKSLRVDEKDSSFVDRKFSNASTA